MLIYHRSKTPKIARDSPPRTLEIFTPLRIGRKPVLLSQIVPSVHLSILDNSRLQTLGILHIHRLNIGIQLLLGTLLIIPLPRDAHPYPERHAFDTILPDFLVQLRVEANVVGALDCPVSASLFLHTIPLPLHQDGETGGKDRGGD